MDADKATKLAQEALIDAHSHFNFGQVKSVAHAILTACTTEAADCEARAVAIDEQNQRLRKFIFELCPHETYLATSMGWIRDQIARASDCEALRAELREARLEEADRCMESVRMLFVSDEGSYTSRQVADKIAALRKVWAKLSENSPGPKGAK